jgi:hypothetical protein
LRQARRILRRTFQAKRGVVLADATPIADVHVPFDFGWLAVEMHYSYWPAKLSDFSTEGHAHR